MSGEEREDISKRLDEIEATLERIEAKLEAEEGSPEMSFEVGELQKGVASGVLESLGGMFPQLDKLLETLKDSPAFQERLQEIDVEVESRIKGAGLSTGVTYRSIPPSVRRGSRKPTARKGTKRRVSKPKARVGTEKLKTVPVDIFDEGDLLKVVAELPGYEEEDIKAVLEGTTLSIEASSPRGKRHNDVELPSEVKEKFDTTFRNGILQVLLKKK